MNKTALSDTEIVNIIDKEIASGNLDLACKAQAELESHGNYDLMISRYFLIRLEKLNNLKVKTKLEKPNRAMALEERKIASANQQLIRYRTSREADNSIQQKQQIRETLLIVIANIILLLSSVSAISAVMILAGHTIHSLPLLKITAVVSFCMCLPFLLSRLPIKKSLITYQAALATICIVTCLGSAASGVLLMKVNPSNYQPSEELAKENPVEQGDSVELSLKPAKTASSVVTNP